MTPLSDAARTALEQLDLSVHPDRDALLARVAGLGAKRRTRIVTAALREHFEDERRHPFRAELVKMQRDVQADGRRVLVLMEGRDGAGKGAVTGRIARVLDETTSRVVPFRRPSVADQEAPYFDRYTRELPEPGEIVFFDRSWYSRALVEPVMGFCTADAYTTFLETVGEHEQRLITSGVTLIKVYLVVSRAEQARRMAQRDDAWLSDVDRQAQERWEAYTDHEETLFQRTHADASPWWVIPADDRRRALLETTKLILREVPYDGRSQTLDFGADGCVDGNVELARRGRRPGAWSG